ncbi:hypothetical protein E2R51_10565 [Jeotgalibacillus sp. S-D1]|uniref:hypothetical protein n=1 Tax=Jeotgalibacillus sp. S-D1 TaxID=2552189 RepID=UPI00105A52FF|nr:hypothetical protein [Jeotgalibacillus sp. S-D1]TDL33090.1 hypothetical protein E2R51_10565 [Jeotgalibacillus sp. S-D1]
MRLKKKVKYTLYITLLVIIIIIFNASVSFPSYNAKSLEAYLNNNIAQKTDGGIITDAYKIYGGNDQEMYLWYGFEVWNREQQDIEAGASLPVVIQLNDQNEPISHEIPEDGSNYTNSMKELFPLYVRIRMNDTDMPGSIRHSIDMQQDSLPPSDDDESA